MRKGSGLGFGSGFGGGLATGGAGAGLSVVIADDSALLREGVAGLLERRGYRIVGQAADSGELMEVMGTFVV